MCRELRLQPDVAEGDGGLVGQRLEQSYVGRATRRPATEPDPDAAELLPPVPDGHVVRVGRPRRVDPTPTESTGASGACRTAAAPCAATARPAASATAGSSVSADGASAIRWLKSDSAS